MLTFVTDCMYPSYDPFEEDPEFGCRTYEDPEEALAVIDRRSQRKRYMVGLFPGVNESFLRRYSIRESRLQVQLCEACNVGLQRMTILSPRSINAWINLAWALWMSGAALIGTDVRNQLLRTGVAIRRPHAS